MASTTTGAGDTEKDAMIDRMLTRLALTDDSKLETVLSKLLPFVISFLSSPSPSLTQKVMEMLKHINIRVKDQPTIQLPVKELWSLYSSTDSKPMVRNFAIIYIEMAVGRLPLQERLEFAPEILLGFSKLPVQHQDMLLRIVAEVMEYHSNGIDEIIATKYRAIQSGEELNSFLGFCLQTILYLPNSTAEGASPGLSVMQTQRILGKQPLKGEKLSKRKLGILNTIESMNLSTELVYHIYIVASMDSQESVSKRGEQLLKRSAPTVNLDDDTLIKNIFSIFLGTVNNGGPSTEEKVSPASLPLKIQFMSVLSRSIKAANSFPATLQCVFECLYGNGSNLRLKQAGMEFTVWVFKHGSINQLNLMGPVILNALLKFLDKKASESAVQSSKEVKEFAYQAIGLLARRSPHLFRENIDIASRLFKALKEEDSSSRFTVQEACNTVAVAYKDSSAKVLEELEMLLLENSHAVESEARFCAVRWATALHNLNHCPSRYICMVGAADIKLDIREMALKGLFPDRQPDGGNVFFSIESEKLPSLHEMLTYIAKQHPEVLKNVETGETKLLFPPMMYAAMIRFCLKCFEEETVLIKEQILQPSDSIFTLCLLLEHAMASEGSVELHNLASKGLLDIAFQYPEIMAKHYADHIGWLKQFLNHIDFDTRVYISRLLGICCSALPSTAASMLIQELSVMVKAPKNKRFEDLHGTICATGYVIAQCMTGSPQVEKTQLQTSILSLVDLLISQNGPLAGAAAEALGHIGLRSPWFSSCTFQLGYSPIEKDASVKSESEPEKVTNAVVTDPLTSDVERSTEKRIAKLSDISVVDIVGRFGKLIASDDIKVIQRVAIACGHICHENSSSELTNMFLDLLFSLSRSKVEDVLYAAGEALAFIWGAVPVSVEEILKSSYISLSISSNYLMGEISSHQFADNMLVDSKIVKDDHAEAREKIIKKLFDELLYSSRKEERFAGSVWLLSLLTYCGYHPRLKEMLPTIQEAFSNLLGDQNEATQEMASRGMTIVYDLGDSSMKADLVKALVGTLTGTAKRKRVVKLDADSEVFEEGTIGERPGGGKLTTYRELCSLATEMGQPDLIYKFMDLANYQKMMNSKRGAAFGFSKIAKQSGDALRPYLCTLVPKLIRYQYDPDKNIQDAMGHIWRSLVAEPKKTIDEYWDDIIEELVAQSGSRLWRARESSCLALTDILQGRKLDQVRKYLKQIWITAFRAMDDIKETVRNAGERLCRTVVSLSLRLCDTSLTSKVDANDAMSIVLPFILSEGIFSKVSSVQKVAINMVTKLAKSAGDAICPHLPDLVACMLESLSSLEDQRLNYAELHAEAIGIQKDKFEDLRITVSRDSPMWETLDLSLRYVNASTLEVLVPRLIQLVRTGVGLNTRVGVARFISMLVQKIRGDIKSYINSLVKALLPALEAERSLAAKKAFAAACGCLLKYSLPSQAEKMLDDAVSLYLSAGNVTTRVTSAVLLQSYSRQSADILKQYHSIVLPVLFVARFDDDKNISSMFEEVWEENSSGESVTVQLYLSEIVSLLSDGMKSSSWARKKQSSIAISKLAQTLGTSISPFAQELLEILLNEIQGRIWEGKEEILNATAAIVEACHESISSDSSINPKLIVSSIVSACSKKKRSYCEAAFLNLEKVIKAFGRPDIFTLVMPFLLETCSQESKDEVSKTQLMAVETQAEDKENLPFSLKRSLDSIAAALHVATVADILAQGDNITNAFVDALHPSNSWQVKLSALGAIQAFYKTTSQIPTETSDLSESSQSTITLILKSFQSLFLLTCQCITNVKIAKVHVAAGECLLSMVEAFCLSTNKLETPLYDQLLQLHDLEKDQSAKLILKKSLDKLEKLIKTSI